MDSLLPESGSLGIPRAEMPQIKADHRGAMTNFMNARGVQHQKKVDSALLHPTQRVLASQRSKKAMGFDGGISQSLFRLITTFLTAIINGLQSGSAASRSISFVLVRRSPTYQPCSRFPKLSDGRRGKSDNGWYAYPAQPTTGGILPATYRAADARKWT